jgi:hypothetical protein
MCRDEGLEHGDQVLWKHGFLLSGRGGVGIADAGEHSGGVPHWA